MAAEINLHLAVASPNNEAREPLRGVPSGTGYNYSLPGLIENKTAIALRIRKIISASYI